MERSRSVARKIVSKVSSFFVSDIYDAIHKSCDIHTWKLRIKKGYDVNCKIDNANLTPLHYACCVDDQEWICGLLYYEADPYISSHCGSMPISDTSNSFVQDVLLPYYTCESVPNLRVVVALMRADTSVFFQYIDYYLVDFTIDDDEDVAYFLRCQRPDRFNNILLFVKKRDYLVWKLNVYRFFDALFDLTKYNSDQSIKKEVLKAFGIFLKDEDIYKHQSQILAYEGKSFISKYVRVLDDDNTLITEEEITQNVLLMVSYGLDITLSDLAAIYRIYGLCELFEILLHMDAGICCDAIFYVSPLFYLYTLPFMTIEHVNNLRIPIDPSLLKFYTNVQLQERCLSDIQKKRFLFNENEESNIVRQFKDLNTFPMLIELSRDVARRHILEKCNITTSKQFLNVLNCLPIDKVTRRIIALQQPINYCFPTVRFVSHYDSWRENACDACCSVDAYPPMCGECGETECELKLTQFLRRDNN